MDKPLMASRPLIEALDKMDCEYAGKIGQGGSATCHIVRSRKYKEMFVCKEMPLNKTQICRECELQALTKLSGPTVIGMYNFVTTPECLYLLLEYCPRGSLSKVIKESGPLVGRQLYGVCKRIINGLKYIHGENCAHLDLKPANLLINKYGFVKLADFGISHMFTRDQLSDQHAGTLSYMAPEVIAGRRYDPFKADIWSLGVTLYYIAFGYVPWSGLSPEAMKIAIMAGNVTFKGNVEPEFRRILSKMLNVKPEDRPTASELAEYPLFRDADMKAGVIVAKPTELRSSVSEGNVANVKPSLKGSLLMKCTTRIGQFQGERKRRLSVQHTFQ